MAKARLSVNQPGAVAGWTPSATRNALVAAIVAASPGPDVLDVGCGTGIAARQFQAAGWDPAGRTFDAVIAGQSWHWVDSVVGATKVAHVLRSGGTLTLFWHVFEPPPNVNDAFATVYQRVVPDSPVNAQANKSGMDVYQAMLTKAGDALREVDGFSDTEQWRFDWEQSYTRQEWLDLLPTTGGLTRLPQKSWPRCYRRRRRHRRDRR